MQVLAQWRPSRHSHQGFVQSVGEMAGRGRAEIIPFRTRPIELVGNAFPNCGPAHRALWEESEMPGLTIREPSTPDWLVEKLTEGSDVPQSGR